METIGAGDRWYDLCHDWKEWFELCQKGLVTRTRQKTRCPANNQPQFSGFNCNCGRSFHWLGDLTRQRFLQPSTLEFAAVVSWLYPNTTILLPCVCVCVSHRRQPQERLTLHGVYKHQAIFKLVACCYNLLVQHLMQTQQVLV